MVYLGLYGMYIAYKGNSLKQQNRFLHMQPRALLAHLDVCILEQGGFPCLGRDCILDGGGLRSLAGLAHVGHILRETVQNLAQRLILLLLRRELLFLGEKQNGSHTQLPIALEQMVRGGSGRSRGAFWKLALDQFPGVRKDGLRQPGGLV